MRRIIKINVTEIARELGISPQYVSMILSGKRHPRKFFDKVNSLLPVELKLNKKPV